MLKRSWNRFKINNKLNLPVYQNILGNCWILIFVKASNVQLIKLFYRRKNALFNKTKSEFIFFISPVFLSLSICWTFTNKSFTSVATLQLVEEGKIGIDDTIGKYFNYFPTDIASKVTIRQLLNISSGWGDYWENKYWWKPNLFLSSFPMFILSKLIWTM